MKTFFLRTHRWLFVLALACLPAVQHALAADAWTPGDGWNLVWADEFDGTAVDESNWGYDLGGGGWGNNELETYTKNNAAVVNGELIITAAREPNGSYTSARLKTQGKRFWQYGKIAARLRLPFGQGIWPAFWMMGENISSVGWPKCGEIDILEMIGGGENRDDTCYGTLHWDENRRHQSVGSGPNELPDPAFFYQDYHVFEIEWSRAEVIWRLDSNEFYRTGLDTSVYPGREEFHRPFFILLNLAVGGRWPGNPDATTVFPQRMTVDWVRVYQNGQVDPAPAPPANLTAETSGKRKIYLSWTQSSSGGITQNRIYRSATGAAGSYTVIATLPATTMYTDPNLASGQTYYYAVTAVSAFGESAFSNYATAKAR